VTVQSIGRLAALESLDLGDCDALDDAGLLPLRALGALRSLGLQRCRWIGDAGCRTLAQVRRRQRRRLRGRGRMDAAWRACRKCPFPSPVC
jgi:hypothetical protein